MGFPPFRGAVRQIILASVGIYVVILLLQAFKPAMAAAVLDIGMLDPAHIRQGWLWQFVTYAFMAEDPWRFLVSLTGIYFLGPSVEDRIGSRRFFAFFFGSIVLSGVAGFLLSLNGVIAQGPAFSVVAAANATLMAFYLFNPDASMMAYFVLQIPAKWLLLFFIALETAYLLLTHFALFYCVALLGFGTGYLWCALFLTRKTSIGVSERLLGLRSSYYKWKRRRAARKFEVYMRDHDRTVTFDEHGNYIPPEDSGKKNGGSKSGWVN
jgi:membrane associated rhomboid family serine protease